MHTWHTHTPTHPQGDVKLNGQSVKDVTLASLRSAIGQVPQVSSLPSCHPLIPMFAAIRA